MKYSELKKLLKKNGCRMEREGANHELWYSPITGKTFPVGRHGDLACGGYRHNAVAVVPLLQST